VAFSCFLPDDEPLEALIREHPTPRVTTYSQSNHLNTQIQVDFRFAATFSKATLAATLFLAGCGPRAHIPPQPVVVANALPKGDTDAQLARSLAPVLYLQRDEWFQLERIVAVLHPNRPIIGYYLLWSDDVAGAWVPFTKPTDEEIVWVGYDSTKAPTEVWTYWHGKILHADWRERGAVEIDVQWGKHGSMPRGIIDDADMWPRTLTNFWVSAWIGLPDMWLGRLSRPGPLCFCHGYQRYRTFDRPIIAGERIDVVVRAENPDTVLSAVFGRPYSQKTPWP